MSLSSYFTKLKDKVEDSHEISNAGKDDNGFYKPKRTILLRHLNLLIDLHQKPLAKDMVRQSWEVVCHELPPDWLILSADEKKELKQILS